VPLLSGRLRLPDPRRACISYLPPTSGCTDQVGGQHVTGYSFRFLGAIPRTAHDRASRNRCAPDHSESKRFAERVTQARPSRRESVGLPCRRDHMTRCARARLDRALAGSNPVSPTESEARPMASLVTGSGAARCAVGQWYPWARCEDTRGRAPPHLSCAR
jgi:hypothetical protein